MSMPKIYEVGGCVRDRIMGLDPKDIDYTYVSDNLNQSVEDGFREMWKYLLDNEFRIFQSTPEMYTIRALFPNDHKHKRRAADFVMARKEVGYIPGTRRPILELGTLEDDLLRRDFTVNAMAEDEEGNLIDLFKGQLHIKQKMLVTPQDPFITMEEDPLRILRAIRFSITKNFDIDPRLWDAITDIHIWHQMKTTVSVERIREELYKCFKHDTPETIKLLYIIEDELWQPVGKAEIPGISALKILFGDGLWLKPTTELK